MWNSSLMSARMYVRRREVHGAASCMYVMYVVFFFFLALSLPLCGEEGNGGCGGPRPLSLLAPSPTRMHTCVRPDGWMAGWLDGWMAGPVDNGRCRPDWLAVAVLPPGWFAGQDEKCAQQQERMHGRETTTVIRRSSMQRLTRLPTEPASQQTRPRPALSQGEGREGSPAGPGEETDEEP